MASYPPELNYAISRLAGYSTNTARLVPQSLQTAGPGEIIQISVPENQVVDLRSLCIMGDLIGIKSGEEVALEQCVLPRLSASLIDMVSVSINGQSIDSSMIGYHHLNKLMHDFTRESRKSALTPLHMGSDYLPQGSGNTKLPLVGRAIGSGTQGLTPAVANSSSAISEYYNANRNALPWAVSDFFGFLGCGKCLDTSTIGQITISIRLAPSAVCMRPAAETTNAPSYVIKNIRAFVNVLDISDGLYYQVLNQRLEQAPLQVNFKRFLSFSAPQLTGSGSVRFSASSQSIDAVYAMFLRSAPGQDAPIVENAVAPFFRRTTRHSAGGATGYIQTVQAELQSVSYPSWAPSVSEQYYLALNAFRLLDDDIHTSVSSMSIDTWHEDLHVFAYRWSHDRGLERISGIDSRGISVTGTINCVAQGALDLMPFVILETTATLNIGKYRSLNLVA